MYKNLTIINKNVLNALNKKNVISVIITYCASLFTLLASCFYFKEGDKKYAVIYLVCSLIFIFLATYLLIYIKNLNKKVLNCSNEYNFEQNFFTVSDSLGNYSKITYPYVLKLKIKKDYLFIYINKVTAYPINLNGFENNDTQKFLNFICQKTNKIIK